MIAFFKLIRFPNLLAIALTQYLVRWCIMHPVLEFYGRELQMTEVDFFLLVLSTVMIAAGGYAINDYFDLKIDRINKPQKMVVGLAIKRRVAMGAHLTMNLIAIAIGVYLAWKVGLNKLALIHIISAMGLWFYSTNLKKQLLTGNLMVAFLAGLVPLTVALYEAPLLIKVYGDNFLSSNSFRIISYFIAGYSILAFFTNLVREIVKDMEDYEGDKKYGCLTFPVSFGMFKSKVLTILLVLTIITALAYFQFQQFLNGNLILFYYLLTALQLPFILSIILTAKAKEKKDLSRISMLTKFILLTGILSMVIFCFTLK